jgi:hypothetical protein
MRIEKKTKKIRNPKYLGRCFFNATPFLPGRAMPKIQLGWAYASLPKSEPEQG